MLKNALTATLAASMVLPAVAVTTVPAEARSRYYTTDNGIRYWRGDDGRYYCRKGNGTTGLLIGGAAGALIGRSVAGNNTTGTIVGAAAGALLGREIQRSAKKARCR